MLGNWVVGGQVSWGKSLGSMTSSLDHPARGKSLGDLNWIGSWALLNYWLFHFISNYKVRDIFYFSYWLFVSGCCGFFFFGGKVGERNSDWNQALWPSLTLSRHFSHWLRLSFSVSFSCGAFWLVAVVFQILLLELDGDFLRPAFLFAYLWHRFIC